MRVAGFGGDVRLGGEEGDEGGRAPAGRHLARIIRSISAHQPHRVRLLLYVLRIRNALRNSLGCARLLTAAQVSVLPELTSVCPQATRPSFGSRSS